MKRIESLTKILKYISAFVFFVALSASYWGNHDWPLPYFLSVALGYIVMYLFYPIVLLGVILIIVKFHRYLTGKDKKLFSKYYKLFLIVLSVSLIVIHKFSITSLLLSCTTVWFLPGYLFSMGRI